MKQSIRFRRTQRPFISPYSGGVSANWGDPIITVLSSGTPNANDATITWTTNIPADTQVFWGLTTAYGGASSPLMNFTYQTSHSQQITGLTSATLYHYKVLSRSPGGTYTFSADQTFTTA